MINARHIIKRIRRQLDQVPMSEEDVKTDSAVIGSPSTNFSDENLLDRINSAQREIVTKVKAQHIPDAVRRYDGPFPTITEEVVRLLYSRVIYTGRDLNGVTWSAYDPSDFYEGTPGAGDVIYSYTAGRKTRITSLTVSVEVAPTSNQQLLIYKNGSQIGTVDVQSDGNCEVTLPETVFSATDNLRVRADGKVDATGIYLSFTGEVQVILAEEVTDARAIQRSVDRHRRLERAGRRATGNYPVFTYEDEQLRIYPNDENAYVYCVFSPEEITPADLANGTDDLTLDERFEAALVNHAIASCYQTLRKPKLNEWTYSRFNEEVDPYALYNRYNSVIDDREVDVV